MTSHFLVKLALEFLSNLVTLQPNFNKCKKSPNFTTDLLPPLSISNKFRFDKKESKIYRDKIFNFSIK